MNDCNVVLAGAVYRRMRGETATRRYALTTDCSRCKAPCLLRDDAKEDALMLYSQLTDSQLLTLAAGLGSGASATLRAELERRGYTYANGEWD